VVISIVYNCTEPLDDEKKKRSESRNAYLSIVASSLGFVGAGANIAVSQLAARSFNIARVCLARI
jgi:hypothetical protein